MKTLYLVEDNDDNAELVSDLMEGEYRLVRFADAQSVLEALDQSPQEPPDLFLLDISLPGMSGLELLGKLRESATWKHIPAIALTAHAMKSEIEGMMSAGFDGYVSKPIIDETALLAVIQNHLEAQ